jgi:hypothetical protein
MSRWFWMIASGMGTIFVPVAEVLSPSSPLLKLGNIAVDQPMALLAVVPVLDGNTNIFGESVAVSYNIEHNNYMKMLYLS